MKKVLIMLAMMVTLPAFAGGTCGSGTDCVDLKPLQFSTTLSDGQQQGQTQGQTATSTSEAQNQGNNQNITFTSPGNSTSRVETTGTQTIKNTPSVGGPPLTTSNDTCMGSTSGSVNIAGLGIGGGSTWTDTNCKRLKNARELWNMGLKGASLALMCLDDENRYALLATGYECPSTPAEMKKKVSTTSTSVQTPAVVTTPKLTPVP